MDYHSHRFHDHSLMLFHQDKLVGLVPGNSVGIVVFTPGSFLWRLVF